ncbi:thiamine pyrophosphokinase [Neocucurbitaria cava]|uniref:Thiamine pyrophosphokinase n=1 Tax=Neocucurbitaria cava TaxID=798079 RepID=A0A9W9CIA0_9PLEO|nr:thiamine pyrophosphokinase [Neocucurbitaria cava]
MKEFGPLTRSRRWKLRPDLDHGQFHFLKKGHDGEPSRQVTVIVGYSFREAEEYVAVREQLLKGKHAEIVIARRADCTYVDPIREMSDADLRCELSDLALLFRNVNGPIIDVAANIDMIKSSEMV